MKDAQKSEKSDKMIQKKKKVLLLYIKYQIQMKMKRVTMYEPHYRPKPSIIRFSVFRSHIVGPDREMQRTERSSKF